MWHMQEFLTIFLFHSYTLLCTEFLQKVEIEINKLQSDVMTEDKGDSFRLKYRTFWKTVYIYLYFTTEKLILYKNLTIIIIIIISTYYLKIIDIDKFEESFFGYFINMMCVSLWAIYLFDLCFDKIRDAFFSFIVERCDHPKTQTDTTLEANSRVYQNTLGRVFNNESISTQ